VSTGRDLGADPRMDDAAVVPRLVGSHLRLFVQYDDIVDGHLLVISDRVSQQY